ncbi:hypothetical protein SDC9_110995 [bioreactor metagenome]|uniref:Uncharacterized protein n=1 Tax=bioreactor metagenome TaxID=1076179 RepID=A0A645BF80_9ZZZZ
MFKHVFAHLGLHADPHDMSVVGDIVIKTDFQQVKHGEDSQPADH